MNLTGKHFYDFGSFSVNVTRRLLLRDGQPVMLGEKALDLLLALIENRGHVVAREDLIKLVWRSSPARHESNLNKQIQNVRNVLGDDSSPSASRYIRTISGEGYQFVADVTERWENMTGAEVARGARSKTIYVAVVAGLAVVASAAMMVEGMHGSEPRITDSHKLTSDGLPKDGPLLTDGRLVYFTERVSHDADSDTQAAAAPQLGGDVSNPQTPVPSAILLDIAGKTGDRLYWSSPRFRDEGSVLLWKSKERSLEDTGLITEQVRISPDGRTLAYGDMDYNLHFRDIGPSPSVRSIPIRGRAHKLCWSIDGERIRFSVLEEPGLSSASLWEIRRDGSNLRQLPVPAEHSKGFLSEGWTADGRYFIFSEHGVLDHHASLWIMRDDSRGFEHPKPVRLSAAADFTAVVAADSKIFAIGSMSHNEVARFDLKKGAFVSYWEGFPAIDISFSNDGARAAFARYPDHTLWISRADGSERRQIPSAKIEVHQPHWSPDGRRIAFMGQEAGKLWRIYVVDTEGGVPQEVKIDDPFDQGVPSWSADGRFLVFGELRGRKPDAEMVIRVLDLQTGAETILPGSRGKWSPRWAPDGRSILAQTTDFKELDLFDCKSQTWRTLARVQSDDASWSADGKFIHFQANTERGRALCRIRVEDRKFELLALQPEKESSWSGSAPDGSPLTFRALKLEEIYALDLKLP